jgi:hypothetical protein
MVISKFISSGLFALLAVLLFSSCISEKLDLRLQAHRDDTAGQIKELLAQSKNTNAEEMDWATAVKLLKERNVSLQQARSRVAQVEKARDEQWKTWIPRLGFYFNFLSSIPTLGALSTGNVSASVAAPLNIPNPFTERAQAFANALSYLEAQDSMELTHRMQICALYRLFSQYESLQKRGALEQDLAEKGIDPATALNQLQSRTTHDESIAYLQSSLAQMLDMPGRKPTPVPATRPKISYEDRIHKLVPGQNYGKLALRMSAYQIEAALLREKGVELRQWPSVWANNSTPSLYQNRQGESADTLNADNIYLYAGLSKTYDITGREGDSVKTAKENTEFLRRSMLLRLDQESRQWKRLGDRYNQVLLKEKITKERLAIIKKSELGSAMSNLTEFRNLTQALESTRQNREQLELEVWLWDDDKWQ